MSETVDFWRGDFGSEYLARNNVAWEQRVPLLRRIAEETGAKSFLDIGTSAGWNLLAIRRASEGHDDGVEMSGVEPHDGARGQAIANGFDVVDGTAIEALETFGPSVADLVITSGVLIHVAPAELLATMSAIAELSRAHVLAIEYDATQETEVEYRGHAGRLWKRPYGELYKSLRLSLEETGEAEGFDKCRYWLLSK